MSIQLEVDDMKAVSDLYSGYQKLLYLTVECKVCGVRREVARTYLLKRVNSRHGPMCTKELSDGSQVFNTFCRVYKGIVNRTSDTKNRAYKNYGGRGIENRFVHFKCFYESMYQKYLEALKTISKPQIDRIDNDGHYEPSNCRFVTSKENANNRRPSTRQKAFVATSPTGEYTFHTSVNKFAKEHGMYGSSVARVLKGRSDSLMGWKFTYDLVREVTNQREG